MPTSEHTALLPASAQRVWDFVTTVRYWPVWLSGVSAIRAVSTASTGAGTTFEVERVGQHQRDPWIVAEWEPPRRVRFTDYHADIQLSFVVAPAEASSELRVVVEWRRPRGPLGSLLAAGVPGGQWARGLPASLARLKDIVVFNHDIKLLHGAGDH